ncbi:MAG: sugar phosphate nucleotidyltransferase, partial [Patescibacteria group bacterium]|nr:sugar phosphate nucleotidyltransferase [Patescibacteria group bacterium]
MTTNNAGNIKKDQPSCKTRAAKERKMKGIILAGGTGSRLWPLTAVTSKQMLPVGGVPMIFHPLNILIKAGITDILIIVSPDHSGRFMNMLEPLLRPYGINILSGVQEVPAGLPEAFTIGAPVIGNDNVTLILGDNIFEDTDIIANAIKNFKSGGHVFAKEVADPERFGVATVDKNNVVTNIVEKPEKPESNLAVTGAYIYDNHVIQAAKELKASERGELEIVDLHNYYLEKKELQLSALSGAWFDAGTQESLRGVDKFAADNHFVDNFDPILADA